MVDTTRDYTSDVQYICRQAFFEIELILGVYAGRSYVFSSHFLNICKIRCFVLSLLQTNHCDLQVENNFPS